MTSVILFCALAWSLLGGFGALRGRTPDARPLVYGASFIVAAIASGAAILQLAFGATSGTAVVLPLGLPHLGMNFQMTGLSAAFLIITDVGAATASLYAVGYGRGEPEAWRVLPFFPLFIAAMNMVLIAADAYDFLIFWELMSLSSWALVVAHHEDEEARASGVVYLVMASSGTLALLLAFGLLAGVHGQYDFASIRAAHPGSWVGAVVMLLALFGAGSKAGLVPLHIWLPRAHPAAPSHVSALMSGVMTKVAVYAFVLIVFDFLGKPAWWWGLIVLIMGGITAVLGVLYALMEHDLKRLLAYHTVENIGIIFIGLGLALAFRAERLDVCAALALAAAVFHAFNHSLFKNLLFLGSGAVLARTGERDMERLGGLLRRMPQTGLLFLIGSVAISGLPPLNGFASEWMLFQAILLSPRLSAWSLKLAVPSVGAMLALAAALSAACFVKVFGITFLGRPRSPAASAATETDAFSRAGMIGLAALCVVVGLAPGMVIDLFAPVTRSLLGARLPAGHGMSWLTVVPVSLSRSSYNPLSIFALIAAGAGFAAVILHRYGSRIICRAPPWGCGYTSPEDATAASPSLSTQYSASGFAQPIRRVFGSFVFNARDQVTMPMPGDVAPAHLISALIDPVWQCCYAPLLVLVGWAADRMNRLQFLTIRRYLTIVFITLVVLLVWVAPWG